MNTLQHTSPVLIVFFLSLFLVNCEKADPEMEPVVESNTEFNVSPLKSEMIFPNTKIEWLVEVISTIEEMVEKGILSKGNANALIVKVKNAIKSIEKGNTNANSGQLSAFIYQVEEFVEEGILEPVDIILFLELINNGPGNTFTDTRNGYPGGSYTYKTIQIGDQVWLAENLRYLPEVSPGPSGSVTDPYYYVYGYEGNDTDVAQGTENYQTYGVLYNWPAAMEGCPDGWHLPSIDEWSTLSTFLGGSSVAGGKLKETGTTHWLSPNTGATNESGFSALPAGTKYTTGVFSTMKSHTYWWSSSLYFTNDAAWNVAITWLESSLPQQTSPLNNGCSIRCVKN